VADMLTPTAPIGALRSPLGDDAQLCVTQRDVQIAAIRLRDALDLPVPWPEARRMSGGDTFALVSTGPGAALGIAAGRDPAWARTLAQQHPSVAIVDQSGGYVVLRISGSAAQRVFSRLMAIDMHPDVFGPGAAAVTTCCGIGVTLWRPGAALAYDMAVPRSYARTFAGRFSDAAGGAARSA
jgi:heterotetrameric sarcosine oxidase gamma subunit